ncbi:site-specific integrase [Herbaspirillum huttiense]|uniref:Site-specific integrase n=1 Tax=Herbaspirillum huttiense subsp. lycopersici TaxID=3074428 RepID=A0ABU2EH72_9BURK|nr:site-specific integrase [Herbaspirillum huttiense]MDR9847132.1 site-specific integrase [Herbaspirillum huttiense SE1]
MATKRRKDNGRWEFIIKRAKLLPKPIYLTFDSEEEGDAYVAKLEALLDRGIVPPELNNDADNWSLLAELIKAYLTSNSVPDSDQKILNVIYARKGTTPLKSINYQWVEAWVQEMKVVLNVSPSTIRHHVGALARCFDFAGRRNFVPLVINPIRQLPKRYAQYTERDTALATAHNKDFGAKVDEERDRRLSEKEEKAIRNVLDKQKPEGRERALTLEYQAALELMFTLALETAMRMRETYTLTLDQVDIERRTIFLDRTKNGHKRQVPMTTVAIAAVETYLSLVKSQERGMAGFNFEGGRLFPWWNGSLDPDYLKNLTATLSAQFGRIFDAAKCPDLRYHDLRHEASSRLYERTSLTDLQIMKITGHSSLKMLKRYANLRASNLADKLW